MAHKAKMLLLVLKEHVYEHKNKRRNKMSSGVLLTRQLQYSYVSSHGTEDRHTRTITVLASQ